MGNFFHIPQFSLIECKTLSLPISTKERKKDDKMNIGKMI